MRVAPDKEDEGSAKGRRAGFTLVELAISMVIIGILATIGASLIGPLTIRMKTTETKDNMSADRDALFGYAVTSGATPVLPALAQFPTVVRSPTDSWGDPVQYIFDNNLTTNVCGRTTTNITLKICSNAACSASTSINNVAFILVSPASNFNNQTAASKAVTVATTINTYGPGIQVDNYPGDMNRPTDSYDDIVVWATLPELQSKLSCGRCSAYEVWNSGAAAYFRVNGVGCQQVAGNNLVSSIGPGGGVNGFSDAACTAATGSMTFTKAGTTDVNMNCAVNFNNTDR